MSNETILDNIDEMSKSSDLSTVPGTEPNKSLCNGENEDNSIDTEVTPSMNGSLNAKADHKIVTIDRTENETRPVADDDNNCKTEKDIEDSKDNELKIDKADETDDPEMDVSNTTNETKTDTADVNDDVKHDAAGTNSGAKIDPDSNKNDNIKMDASTKSDLDVEKSTEAKQSSSDAETSSQLNTDAEASNDSHTNINNVIKEEPVDLEYETSTWPTAPKATPSSRPKRSRKQKQPLQSVAVSDVNIKTESADGYELSSTTESDVIRPKSPTKSCSVMQEDVENLSQALVETSATGSEADGLYDTGSNRMVCAIGTKVALITPSGEASGDNITCFWCNFCPFKTEQKDMLVKHIMEHRFHCKICTFQSYNRLDVIHHSVESHTDYEDTANSLFYCTFLPDFLNGGMSGDINTGSKRKLSATQSEFGPSSKNSRMSTDREQDGCAFEMEVDEVEDNSSQDQQGRIMVPSGKRRRKQTPASRIQNRPITAAPITTTPQGSVALMNIPVVVGTPSNQMFLISNPHSQSMSTVLLQNQMATASPSGGQTGIQSIASTIVQQHLVTPSAPPKATPSAATKQQTKKTAGNVTVSSGLCWKCGYCDFITLRQAFLKTHLKTKHGTKAHKYVAMLISSQEEMNKIKQQDAQVLRIPESALTSASSLLSTITAANLSSNRSFGDASALNTDDVPELTEEELANSNEPLSYKCAHCNFTNFTHMKVKEHMFLKHPACVYYALDMRAVKLKQRQYLFFCHKKNCDFSSKDTVGYLKHTEECTPWTDDTEDVEDDMKKSLEFTKQFANKIAGKTLDMVKNLKNVKNAEYSCIFCSYVSNNNTRLKKHVLTNHSDRDAVMKDLQAMKINKKDMVYFCRICLWETRNNGDVSGHMASRHKDLPTEPPRQTVDIPMVVAAPAQKPLPIAPSLTFSSPPLSAGSVVPNPKTKKICIEETDMQKMRDDYVAHHVQVTPTPPSSRPRREAAAKAQRKFMDVDQYPPIYSCLKCNEMCFGITLMRKHILEAHPGELLLALDIDQTKTQGQDFCCLCPDTDCNFFSIDAEGMVSHAMNKHDLDQEHPLLVGLKEAIHEINSPPPSPPPVSTPSKTSGFRVKLTPSKTSSFLEAYECLYCMGIVCSTIEMMKEHFEEIHTGDDIIFRDCAAWRQHMPSRTYMCSEVDCSFTAVEQKDFTLHGLAHKQAKIFECSLCQWFTTDEAYVSQHKTELHSNMDSAISMEITLCLDGDGNVVKKIGDVVIKQEPV